MLSIQEIKNKSRDIYPAILLESFTSRKSRRAIRRLAFYVMTAVFLLMMYEQVSLAGASPTETLFKLRSAFILIFIIWMKYHLLEAFYLSYYFKKSTVDFEVAQFAFSQTDDSTKQFLESEIGEYLLCRLDVNCDKTKAFLGNDSREKISPESLRIGSTKTGKISVLHLGHTLYQSDKSFSRFLANNNIDERVFLEALNWVDDILYYSRDRGLIFQRENLERIPSIGKNWTTSKFGSLDKFTEAIHGNKIYNALADHWKIYKTEAEQVENSLLGQAGQNILLVTPHVESGIEIISAVGKMIMNGTAAYKIEDKDIFIFKTEKFIAESPTKEIFKNNLQTVLVEAHNCRNIILVLPQFSKLVDRAAELDVDLNKEIMSTKISKEVHVIALADSDEYYSTLQTQFDLKADFEIIEVREVNKKTVLRILQAEVLRQETRYNVFFTYQVLDRVYKIFEEKRESQKDSRDPYAYIKEMSQYLKKIIKQAKINKQRYITLKHLKDVNDKK